MGRKTTTLLNTIASNRPQRPSITAPKSHVKTITAPLKIGHHLNYRSNSTAHQLLPQQITNIIVIKRTTVHVKRTAAGLTWDFKMLAQKFNYPLDIHQNYKLNVLNCNDNLYNNPLECGSTSRKPLVDNSNTFKVSFFIGNKFAGKNDKSWNRQRHHWPTVPIMRPKNYPPEAKRIQKFLWHKVHFLLSNKKIFVIWFSKLYRTRRKFSFLSFGGDTNRDSSPSREVKAGDEANYHQTNDILLRAINDDDYFHF